MITFQEKLIKRQLHEKIAKEIYIGPSLNLLLTTQIHRQKLHRLMAKEFSGNFNRSDFQSSVTVKTLQKTNLLIERRLSGNIKSVIYYIKIQLLTQG